MNNNECNIIATLLTGLAAILLIQWMMGGWA
jgi:uncharacterized membrane protein